MNSKRLYWLGIMACASTGFPPFREKETYAAMCRFAEKLDVQVYVFSPLDADPDANEISAYSFRTDRAVWEKRRFPLPDLVYDRMFPPPGDSGRVQRLAAARFLASSRRPLLSRSAGSKGETLAVLRAYSALRPHLPATELLGAARGVLRRLREQGAAFLKPDCGMQGRGTVLLLRVQPGDPAGVKKAARYFARGRDAANRPFSRAFANVSGLLAWLRRFTAGRSYLVQDYLDLRAADGAVCDIRSLVQKDGSGRWSLTGLAVRRGGLGSVTSNLHGGGDAEDTDLFLEEQFGVQRAAEIKSTLCRLSREIPNALEHRYGALAELGLDFGVERDGRVWFIEANSKPGRSAFRRLGNKTAAARSVLNPVAYARYLLDRRTHLTPFRALDETEAVLPGKTFRRIYS